MGTLSDDQFTGKVNAGGASRRLLGNTEAKAGTPQMYDLFAVGQPGHEAEYAHPVVRQQVQDHAKAMLADPLLRSNPVVLQGGWKQGSTVTLDASELHKGRTAAVELGHHNRQKAVYDMGFDRDVFMKRPAVKPTERVRGSRRTGYVVKNRRAG